MFFEHPLRFAELPLTACESEPILSNASAEIFGSICNLNTIALLAPAPEPPPIIEEQKETGTSPRFYLPVYATLPPLWRCLS